VSPDGKNGAGWKEGKKEKKKSAEPGREENCQTLPDKDERRGEARPNYVNKKISPPAGNRRKRLERSTISLNEGGGKGWCAPIQLRKTKRVNETGVQWEG